MKVLFSFLHASLLDSYPFLQVVVLLCLFSILVVSSSSSLHPSEAPTEPEREDKRDKLV